MGQRIQAFRGMKYGGRADPFSHPVAQDQNSRDRLHLVTQLVPRLHKCPMARLRF